MVLNLNVLIVKCVKHVILKIQVIDQLKFVILVRQDKKSKINDALQILSFQIAVRKGNI